MSKRDWPWVTIALVVVNVAAFGWELAAGADPGTPTVGWMVEHGANIGQLSLGGEPWRLLTSMFLHYGLFHLLSNMVSLTIFGFRVEAQYGRAGFTALYMVGGLAGSLASAARTNVVSAGASGAVFAVFGAFGAYLLLHRDRLDRAQVSRQAQWLIVLLAANLYLGTQANGIDLVAHVGGLVVGFGAGTVLQLGTRGGPSTLKRSIAVGVLGTALIFGATFVIPAPRNAEVDLRNRVTDVDIFVIQRQKVISQPGTTIDEARRVIDNEILPAIREIRQAYERDGEGPDARDVRTYLRLREEAYSLESKALRDNDEKTMDAATAKFREANALVEAINKRNSDD